jgi:ADP-heptose:LPS heptosyltransferase
MRRILVLRGGALGDFLVTLPALAALRRAWPDARLELVGNATAATVVHGTGLLDAVHAQHQARWSALLAPAPLPADFAGWLATFDLVVNFWPDADGVIAARFPLRAAQHFLCASPHPVLAPAAAHFVAALAPLGIVPGDYLLPLRRQTGVAIPADAPIAIHPGSGSPAKNWPLDRWAALCEWLQRVHAARLLVITGEAEPDAAQALARFGVAAHGRPLDELCAMLAGCCFFVGHDSGISHLAAACGVPGVLLFGPTDPAVWAPPTPAMRVIQQGRDLAAIALADVCGEVSRHLPPV